MLDIAGKALGRCPVVNEGKLVVLVGALLVVGNLVLEVIEILLVEVPGLLCVN